MSAEFNVLSNTKRAVGRGLLLAMLCLSLPQESYAVTYVEPSNFTFTYSDGTTHKTARPGDVLEFKVTYQENDSSKFIRVFGSWGGFSQSSGFLVTEPTSSLVTLGTVDFFNGAFTPAFAHDCRINTNSPCDNYSTTRTFTGKMRVSPDMMTPAGTFYDFTVSPPTLITVPPKPIPYGMKYLTVGLSWPDACNTLVSTGSMSQDCSRAISFNKGGVTLEVLSNNSPPTVTDTSLNTSEDISASIVLQASDPDEDDTHTFQIVSPVNSDHGAAFISGNKLTFVPKPNWNGQTSLTYKALDKSGETSNTATVTITVTPVNDPPVAISSTLILDEDTTGTGTLTATDIDSPPPTVFQIVTAPNADHGTATISGSELTFTPKQNWNGTTTLTFRAQDNSGAWSAPATVTIIVRPVNDAPEVFPRSLTINEDTVGKLTLTATDVDSSIFSYEIVEQPAFGFASILDSLLTYTPPVDWYGTTTLTYRAKDDSGAWSAPATITITVTPVNDAPVVLPLSLTLSEDTPSSFTLQAVDIDSLPNFVFELVVLPPLESGSATIQGDQLLFEPAKDWNGTVTLSYRAKDPEGDWSATAQITLTVTPVNDRPTQAGKLIFHTIENMPAVVRGAVTH